MFGKLGLFRKTRVKKVSKSLKKQTKKIFNKFKVLNFHKKRKKLSKRNGKKRKTRQTGG